MNTITVSVNGDDFILSEFFDCDKGDGTTVKDAATGEIIGEMWGMTRLPAPGDEDNPEDFDALMEIIEQELEDFLIENYY